MELNRHYYRFVELKVTEKKVRFSGGLTEYFPPNPQLVKKTIFQSESKKTKTKIVFRARLKKASQVTF